MTHSLVETLAAIIIGLVLLLSASGALTASEASEKAHAEAQAAKTWKEIEKQAKAARTPEQARAVIESIDVIKPDEAGWTDKRRQALAKLREQLDGLALHGSQAEILKRLKVVSAGFLAGNRVSIALGEKTVVEGSGQMVRGLNVVVLQGDQVVSTALYDTYPRGRFFRTIRGGDRAPTGGGHGDHRRLRRCRRPLRREGAGRHLFHRRRHWALQAALPQLLYLHRHQGHE
jgi:hypothetical protein